MSNKEDKILQARREQEIFEFIKNLALNAMGIEDNLISVMADDYMNPKKKISQEKFNKNFNSGFERYFYNPNENLNYSESEKNKFAAGLNFMKGVVQVHGTNEDNIKAAVVAVTDYFAESQDFSAKLMQSTLGTKEYREEFEKEQNKEEEEVISLVRNNEI